MKTEITNIVATARLSSTLVLKDCLSKLPHAVYDSAIFPAIRYKPDMEKSLAFLIYSTGSVVIAGSKAIADIKPSCDVLAGQLGVTCKDVVVRNIVGMLAVGREMILENVAKLENVEYNPENFPGARLRIQGVLPAFLVFKSGRCIIAGSRSMDEFDESAVRLVKLFDANKTVYK
jgi:transcription initiation factor TFIID TATA-box-binding protein